MNLSRHQAVTAHIAALAHEYGPGVKLPTIAEMRDRLGATTATISGALDDLERREIITRRHGVGIFASPWLNHRTLVLLLASSFIRGGASPFWDMLTEEAFARAAERAWRFSMHLSHDDRESAHALPDGLVNDMGLGKVDGILAIGVNHTAVRFIEERRIPLVSYAGPASVQVGVSDVIAPAVGALAAMGCRRIGLWTPVTPFRATQGSGEEERKRFAESLAAVGLTFDSALVRSNMTSLPPASHKTQGYQTAREVFIQPKDCWPDGVVSTDDMLTQGALIALTQRGISLEQHLHIATHANVFSDALLGYEEELTRVEVNPREIAARMFTLLELLMRGETPEPALCTVGVNTRLPGEK